MSVTVNSFGHNEILLTAQQARDLVDLLTAVINFTEVHICSKLL